MTADATARNRALSPLSAYAGVLAAVAVRSNGALSLAEVPFTSMVNLRLAASESESLPLLGILGIDRMPLTGQVVHGGDLRVLGLGPDEWLVVGPSGASGVLVEDLRSSLTKALGRGAWSVVDVSAARTTIAATGPSALDALAHGCALDLDPRHFGPGARTQCAQTMLARAQVVLVAVDGPEPEPGVEILVHSSFAGYLADWLLDAATELMVGQDRGR